MNFSKDIFDKAINCPEYGGLAWRREDITEAMSELSKDGFAVLGGDVWAVFRNNQNLNSLSKISPRDIKVGMIEDKNGKLGVYAWSSDKKESESWDDYVERSRAESVAVIEKMNAEHDVASELQSAIYYNLVYKNEDEYRKLILRNRAKKLEELIAYGFATYRDKFAPNEVDIIAQWLSYAGEYELALTELVAVLNKYEIVIDDKTKNKLREAYILMKLPVPAELS